MKHLNIDSNIIYSLTEGQCWRIQFWAAVCLYRAWIKIWFFESRSVYINYREFCFEKHPDASRNIMSRIVDWDQICCEFICVHRQALQKNLKKKHFLSVDTCANCMKRAQDFCKGRLPIYFKLIHFNKYWSLFIFFNSFFNRFGETRVFYE